MSYFSEVYGDPELSAKAKLVLNSGSGTPSPPWPKI